MIRHLYDTIGIPFNSPRRKIPREAGSEIKIGIQRSPPNKFGRHSRRVPRAVGKRSSARNGSVIVERLAGGQPVATTRSDVVRNVHFRNMRAVGAPPPRVTPVHSRYKHTCLMVLAPRFHHYSANTWSSSIARYTCTRVPLPSTGTFQSCDLLCLNPRLGFLSQPLQNFFEKERRKIIACLSPGNAVVSQG